MPRAIRVAASSGRQPDSIRGSSLDIAFTQNRATVNGRPASITSLLSCSRASTKLAQYASGAWGAFAANTLAITDQGCLIEEARTNSIRNNSMTGAVVGTPGTLPTNWGLFNLSTLAQTVVGTGTDQGLPYIDFRFVGNATTALTLRFDGTTSLAASNGQTWTGAFFASLLSGSFANTTLTSKLTFRDSGGSSLTSSSVNVTNGSVFGRTVNSFTAANASTAAVTLDIQFSTTGAVDFTVRIYAPQLELGAFATSPILTTSAAVTRAADIITLQGAALSAALNAKAARFETNGGEGISTGARLFDSAAGRLMGFASTSAVQISNATNSVSATLGAGSYAGTVKSAFGFDSASMTAVANGGTQATSANAWGSPSSPVYVGNNSGGTRALNGYMRRFTLGTTKGMFDGLTV